MAEFLNQRTERAPVDEAVNDGFNAMGKTVPLYRRQAALEHATAMGLDAAKAWECVGAMAEALERDKPYQAMEAGMRFVDLTGTYRLIAVLLTATPATKKGKTR